MRYDKLEAVDEVVKRLFDPRYSYKKAYIPLELKYAYLQHYLEAKWTEIVGTNLARSCSIEKIVVYDAVLVPAKNQCLSFRPPHYQEGVLSYRRLYPPPAGQKAGGGAGAAAEAGVYEVSALRRTYGKGPCYVQHLRA